MLRLLICTLGVGLALSAATNQQSNQVTRLNNELKAQGYEVQIRHECILVHTDNNYIALQDNGFVQGDQGEQEWDQLMLNGTAQVILEDVFGHHNVIVVDDLDEWRPKADAFRMTGNSTRRYEDLAQEARDGRIGPQAPIKCVEPGSC